MKYSQFIINRRNSLGLSQNQLARASGLSLAQIQNMESGRANPSLSSLESVLSQLGFGLILSADQSCIEKILQIIPTKAFAYKPKTSEIEFALDFGMPLSEYFLQLMKIVFLNHNPSKVSMDPTIQSHILHILIALKHINRSKFSQLEELSKSLFAHEEPELCPSLLRYCKSRLSEFF